ncbi:ATP-binding protein [Candidatus Halobeggiatoa sp. HSG11]|nr:ATP-binding protein [Candidatus Halobeggiatoa sp. HSG11]
MLKKHLSNLSLNTLLIIMVITTVVVAITIYTVFTYNTTKEKRFTEIKKHSQLLIDVTNQVIGQLIASYNVNEYEQILIGEMGSNDILAIIINDNNMGKILGQETFVNGKIRNDKWEIIDFDYQSELHKELLKKNCYVVKSDIIYNGSFLGTVEIYGADRFMNIELNKIIQLSIIHGIILSFFLITTLLISIRFIVINPLNKIIHAISNADKDGIPLNNIPISGSSEMSSFSVTMNNMIDMIRQSRVKLQTHQENLEKVVTIRTQELVKEKQNADRANQAKSIFLTSMSHELRTPLNGILGFAQILQRDSSITTKQQHGLNIIKQSGNHLLSLINDVLDLAKVEAGKIELYEIDFNLPLLLNNVSELIKVKTKDKGVDFYLKTMAELPKAVYGDERRLRQILLNLLGNAIKFTDEGSVTLEVKSEKLIVENEKSQCLLYFSIQDTGVGISPENLKNIFKPFKQVGEQERQAKGTGLGLAISENLVKLMDGQLKVSSQINTGTQFWFELTLPIVDYNVAKISNKQPIIGIKGESPKVLIVDDNLENRLVVFDLLAQLGFNVESANDGCEGLEKAINWQPDVIITDLVMPKMDGFELIRQLRQSKELKEKVIIASSASAYDEDKNRSLAIGCNAFLSKPIQVKTLLEQLQQYLNLTWIYENTNKEIANENHDVKIILPPLAELDKLYNLSRSGNIHELEKQAAILLKSDTKLKPFITEVQAFLEKYQLGKLKKWLEEKMANEK